MKRLLLFILTIAICLGVSNVSIYALEDELTNEDIQFIDNCFNGKYIIYENNEIVTEDFLDTYKNLYDEGNYEEIIKCISSPDCNYSFLGGSSVVIEDTPEGIIMYLTAKNSCYLENIYRSKRNYVQFIAKAKFIDSTGDCVETYPIEYKIIENGNIDKTGTKNSQTPVITQGTGVKNPDKVTYKFGVYVKHTDGTYFDPSETIKLVVVCTTDSSKQPSVSVIK